MSNSKFSLTALTFAVLLIGSISPAFADPSASLGTSGSPNSVITLNNANAMADEIYNNGVPNDVQAWNVDHWVTADDFEFDEDMVLVDIHFWTYEDQPSTWDGTIEYFIFSNISDEPGIILTSGNATLIDRVNLGASINFPFKDVYEYWVDLETPIELEGETRYWVGLHLSSDFLNGDAFWATTDNEFGNARLMSEFGTFDNWGVDTLGPGTNDVAFFLTGHPPKDVGGEFLPIDTTALLLAGIQSSPIWILSTFAAVASAAFGALYITLKRI